MHSDLSHLDTLEVNNSLIFLRLRLFCLSSLSGSGHLEFPVPHSLLREAGMVVFVDMGMGFFPISCIFQLILFGGCFLESCSVSTSCLVLII